MVTSPLSNHMYAWLSYNSQSRTYVTSGIVRVLHEIEEQTMGGLTPTSVFFVVTFLCSFTLYVSLIVSLSYYVSIGYIFKMLTCLS